MTPKLTVIHLARRPLQGTVAVNALKYGTGGLNIDGCRIGFASALDQDSACLHGRATSQHIPGDGLGDDGAPHERHAFQAVQHPAGRWPANLILSHLCLGDQSSLFRYNRTGGGCRKVGDAWECAEGCPVRDLDEQSGVLTSGTGAVKQATAKGFQGNALGKESRPVGTTMIEYGDTGGASRFFQQVQGTSSKTPPVDLLDYLNVLISPPPTPTSPHAQVWGPGWPWVGADNPNSQVGLIIHGFVPTEGQAAILFNTLVPGGHICLIAPDDQPTGHTGAIRLEDAGFEIRDAILWVRGPGRLHYVAKAARAEREAGCRHLPARRDFEAVDREDGTAGVANPRVGAGRTAKDRIESQIQWVLKPNLPPEVVKEIKDRLLASGVAPEIVESL